MTETKNKKYLVDKFLSETPKEFDYFLLHSMEFSSMLESILAKDNTMNQRKLADKIGKEESEISRWLSGNHNLTLRSIAKIEAALGSQLLYTRSEIIERFIPYIFRQLRSEYDHEMMVDLLSYYAFMEPLEDISPSIFTLPEETKLKGSKVKENTAVIPSESKIIDFTTSMEAEYSKDYCLS